jgi:hypothetical protein
MPVTIDATAVAALADERLDWRYKGLPSSWWGWTPAQVCAGGVDPFADGRVVELIRTYF